MRNKIIVTGAAGFIGFHVCEKLIELDQDILGIDNINSYYETDGIYRKNANQICHDYLNTNLISKATENVITKRN